MAVPTIHPGSTQDVSVSLVTNGPVAPPPPSPAVQMALKNNVGVHYFQDNCSLHAVFAENGMVSLQEYPGKWQSFAASEKVALYQIWLTLLEWTSQCWRQCHGGAAEAHVLQCLLCDQ